METTVLTSSAITKQDANLVAKAHREATRMVRYVVGLVFSEDSERVLLIHKAPDCPVESLRNTWNGIGGKQERDKFPKQAMRRECREESGLHIARWQLVDVITDNTTYRVHVFMATAKLEDARTLTKEEVGVFTVELARTMDLAPGLQSSLDKALQYA